MKHKHLWLLFILAIVLVLLLGARRFPEPEGPASTTLCTDGIDQDHDGTVDNCSGSADMTNTDGNVRGIDLNDAVLFNTYASFSDNTAPGDNSVVTNLGNHPFDGGVTVGGSFANATYYAWVLVNNPTNLAEPLWITEGAFLPHVSNTSFASFVPVTNGYEAIKIGSVGSGASFQTRMNDTTQRSFALNGSHWFSLRWEPDLRVACLFFSDDAAYMPPVDTCTVSGGTPAPSADYTIYRVTSAVTETSTSWDNATILPFAGFDNTTGLSASVCKALWQDTTTDRFFVRCEVPDTQLINLGHANDANGIITGSIDRVDVRWKADQIVAFDANTFINVVDTQSTPAYADGDYSGTGGSRTLTPDRNTSTSITINASTDYRVFFATDLGFDATQGDVTLCQFAIGDADTGSNTAKFAFGTTSSAATQMSQFGTCQWSSTEVPSTPDTTAPTVTAASPPEENISSSAADIRFTTDEAGTAVVTWGTTTGVYPNTSASKSVSATATQTITLTGLASNTQIFYKVQVTDGAGNAGLYATEEDFTTTSLAVADHYVGPTTQGTADCSSDANRCLLATALTNVAAGEVITMADGTYTGANSMLDPADGKSGTNGNPITVRATNDGGVVIDGQNVREPCKFRGNDWWTVEGIDCARSVNSSLFLQGSTNFTAKRVIAYDGTTLAGSAGNFTTISLSPSSTYGQSSNTLLEDVAWFGGGRKGVCCGSSGSDNIVFRRVWGAFGGSSNTGPKMAISLWYNTYGTRVENGLFTWTVDNSVEFGTGHQTYGVISRDRIDGSNACVDAVVQGTIAYHRATHTPEGQGIQLDDEGCVTLQDLVVYIEPGLSNTNILGGCDSRCSADPQLTLQNVSLIGGGGNTINAHWAQNSVATGSTVGSVPNIWDGAGTNGARVCYRYINGVKTTQKLWPWPMNERIKDAVVESGRSLTTFFGGASNGPTELMASIFGTIPAACTD